MSRVENGGYAFPHNEKNSTGGHFETHGGMTLRDYFATHAPEPSDWWWHAEECPTPPPGWSEGDGAIAWEAAQNRWRIERLASWAWHYADAMLAERDK